MSLFFLIKMYVLGLGLGIGAAMAPGPINIELIRRSVARGPRTGISFGLGAVSADIAYISMVIFGAQRLMQTMPQWGHCVMFLVGAIILVVLGVKALTVVHVEPAEETERAISEIPPELEKSGGDPDVPVPAPATIAHPGTSMLRNYLLGLFLCGASPTTILYWATFGFGVTTSVIPKGGPLGPVVLGMATGCILWVGTTVYLSSRLHQRISPRITRNIERVLGTGLLIFAAVSAWRGISVLLEILRAGNGAAS